MAGYARFDDLRRGVAWEFTRGSPRVAVRNEEVAGLLAEVEAAAAGGWWAYGFVAYEAAAALDPALAVHPPVPGLPLAAFVICPPPTRAVPVQVPPPGRYALGNALLAWDEDTHRARVDAVRQRIAAGDTYQANLTTALSAPFGGDSQAFYADLALGQRGAYNAYLELGRFAVASASPELFFATHGPRIVMAPMKGTAPRGTNLAEDAAVVAALRGSEKERAENIMIVDLVRNDLARVACTGSVQVAALCRVERYETVHQLTSEVVARLLPGTRMTDLFRALFPCGSVTGAPKPRTMEILRALEDGPRGVYCGAIGMVAPPEAPFQARFSVPIRTAVVDRASGRVTYGVGGGITWGSDPGAEFAEVRAKAEILTRLAPAAIRP